MKTACLTAGSSESGWMVWTPEPGILKSIVSTPEFVSAFASSIAWRSDSCPVGRPPAVSRSLTVLTIKVESRARSSIRSSKSGHATERRVRARRRARPSPVVDISCCWARDRKRWNLIGVISSSNGNCFRGGMAFPCADRRRGSPRVVRSWSVPGSVGRLRSTAVLECARDHGRRGSGLIVVVFFLGCGRTRLALRGTRPSLGKTTSPRECYTPGKKSSGNRFGARPALWTIDRR